MLGAPLNARKFNTLAFCSTAVRTVLLSVVLTLLGSSAFALNNSGITYEGRILNPDGTELVDSAVQFKIQIRTPDANNCLMFEEIQIVDMSTTGGTFALTINDGSGTRTDSSGYGIDVIFANRGSFSFNPAQCVSGSTYPPGTSDGRRLQVYFKSSAMPAWEPLPNTNLNFIPQAIESQQVGGYKPGDLLRVDKTPAQTVAAFTYADYTNLVALLAGTSTQYLSTSTTQGAALPSYASNPGAPSSGSLWYDATLKQVKYFDGSTIKTFGTASGAVGVSSILTGTGLTGGPIAASGTISIANSGVDTPQIASSAITDPKIASGTITGDKFDPAITISTSGNITASQVSTTSTSVRSLLMYDPGAPGIHKITLSAPASLPADYSLALPVSAPAASQIMQSDALGNLSWTSISAAVTSFLSGSAAAPGWAVTGNTNTGLFSPASNTISLSAGGIEGLRVNTSGGAADYIAVTPGGVSSTQISTAGTDASVDIKFAPKGAGNSIFANGNVGIGTTNPLSSLDISGISNSNYGGGGILRIQNTFNAVGAASKLVLLDNSGNYRSQFGHSSASFTGYGAVPANSTYIYGEGNGLTLMNGLAGATSVIRFVTNGINASDEKMRIDNVGNVGIGTTAPNARLDVNGKFILEASSPGSGYAGFAAPASMATSTIWTLPAADGASGTTLSTNGSGILSWAAASAAPTSFFAGSAAAPGWAVTGNANTGLFSAASNTLSIATGGFEGLRVNQASGSNYITVTPGGASSTSIGAAGVDTSIDLTLTAKGAGSAILSGGGATSLTASATQIKIPLATTSNNFASGALVVSGGVGVGGSINAGGGISSSGQSYLAGGAGIGNGVPSPLTAILQIGAGASTPKGAPIKFTTGLNLATPEAGALEYDGNFLYITNASGARNSIATSATAATSFSAGSAAAPGWAVTGNINTGLFSAASNTLSMATGGFEGLRVNQASGSDYVTVTPGGASSTSIGVAGVDANVDLKFAPKGGGNSIFANGNVGIGTTAPAQALEVVTNGNSSVPSNPIRIRNTFNGNAAASLYMADDPTGVSQTMFGHTSPLYNGYPIAGGNAGILLTQGTNGLAIVSQNAAGVIKFATGGSAVANERVRIDSLGNVGIGTTAPASRLEIQGSAFTAGPQSASAANGGEIRMRGLAANGSQYVAFRAPDVVAASTTWTLPAADGASGTTLSTNGSGILSWATAAAAPTSFLSGSAAAPGWAVTGNTNTGLFSAASNTISLSAGGIEGLRVNTAGGATDYIAVTPGGVSSTQISTAGTDANVDLKFAPKGVGNTIFANGNIGIGTTSPSKTVSLDGSAARTLWLERQPAAASGSNFSVQAGGAGLGGTNSPGGDLYLMSGLATGNRGSNILFQTYGQNFPASGNSDNPAVTVMQISPDGSAVHNYMGQNSGAANNGLTVYNSMTSNQGAAITLRHDRANTALQANDIVAQIDMAGMDSISARVKMGQIRLNATNITSGSVASTLSFAAMGSSTLNDIMTLNSSGLAIGASSATAGLLIRAASGAASSAPLKFTAGTNLSTPEAGAVEFDGNLLYITNASGARSSISTSATSATSFLSGSAAAPGWAVTGNANTGLFSAASNTLSIATGGFEGLRVNQASGSDYVTVTPGGASSTSIGVAGVDANVDLKFAPKGVGNSIFANGNVGIGTTAPAYILDVDGSATTAGARIIKNSGAMTDTLTLRNAAGGGAGSSMVFDNGGAGGARIFYLNATPALQFNANGTGSSQMLLLSNGNVGIGTTAPASRLEVQGGAFTAGPTSASAAGGGEIRMRQLASNGSQYVAFRAPDVIAASTTWTLPSADGASGTTLVTNGIGKLIWSVFNAIQLQGINVSSTPPTNGQVLTYNTVGPQWQATDPPGGNPTLITQAGSFAVGVGDANRVFLVTALATVSLPAVGSVPSGFKVTIKRVTTSSVNIVTNAAETIDGSSVRVLSTNYAAMTVANTGTQWVIIDGGATVAAGGCTPGQQVFSSPGSYTLTITAPQAASCTYSVTVKAAGGSAGGGGVLGGTGGAVQFNYVPSGAGTMNVLVGGKGTTAVGGYGGGGGPGLNVNGGGGGGASSVTFGATLLSVVGGGGGGAYPYNGGNGGSSGAGLAGGGNLVGGAVPTAGGANTGGTAGVNARANGGAGGSASGAGANGVSDGAATGGAGGSAYATFTVSGGGGGGGSINPTYGRAGGGGGGGYGGGGGGGGGVFSTSEGESGAGGGGYINGGAVTGFGVITATPTDTDGSVTINWN
jgi:hypothetical protein